MGRRSGAKIYGSLNLEKGEPDLRTQDNGGDEVSLASWPLLMHGWAHTVVCHDWGDLRIRLFRVSRILVFWPT